jgi:hypothetical protein
MKLRALRNLDYGTRRLKAGDEFDPLQSEHTRFLTQTGFAEEIVEAEAPSPRRRLRTATSKTRAVKAESKPEPEPEPEQQSEPEEKPLEEHTRAELLELAEEKEIELPSGYVRKEDLVDIIRDEAHSEDE